MSQNSIILPTTGTVSGLQMTQDTNNALDTLNTLFSGASTPSSPSPFQWWADTTNGLLKQRNAANNAWIIVGTLGLANLGLVPATSLRGFLAGLTLSLDLTYPNTKIDVAAGSASDSGGTTVMSLPSAATIDFTINGLGGLDAGSLAASTWYHCFLVSGASGVAAIASTSLAPSLSGYVYRRLGSLKTDPSGHIIPFFQFGDEFQWSQPINDVNNVTLGTTQTLYTLSVPPGFFCSARIRGFMANALAGANALINSPQETGVGSNATNGNVNVISDVSNIGQSWGEIRVITNTSSQIRAVANTANSNLSITTVGWTDLRGK